MKKATKKPKRAIVARVRRMPPPIRELFKEDRANLSDTAAHVLLGIVIIALVWLLAFA